MDYRKPAIVLITVALCLYLIHYAKFASSFYTTVNWLQSIFGNKYQIYFDLQHDVFGNLYTEVWWTFWHLIGYVVVPFIIIKFFLKEPLRDYGLGLGKTATYTKYYFLLASPIVFFAFLVSFREDFANHYPFYKLASRSIFDLLAWECLYILQFVFLEFFFRGFILHALKPRFGASAIFIMSVPYLMIHFPKPWLEAFGAIPFGILLGILALRSRSIWGGAVVHITVALSMDLLALFQGNKLPTDWWIQ
ncbi:MAG: CPBP family intramembrane metalloprotease [Gammaproteobacteria bacterium]|nr:CPBP family intramembrane metalloprotease [Gammaproteobacteria bacterium]